jgi:hypothetical protein
MWANVTIGKRRMDKCLGKCLWPGKCRMGKCHRTHVHIICTDIKHHVTKYKPHHMLSLARKIYVMVSTIVWTDPTKMDAEK